jgi:cytochrome c oxidase assembly protein subunit 15
MIAWRIRTIASDRRAMTPALSRWIGIALFQAALGYVQYFSDVPELLVGIHVLGATLVMIATTLVVLDTRRPDDVATHDDTRHDDSEARHDDPKARAGAV